jgi:predicted porin
MKKKLLVIAIAAATMTAVPTASFAEGPTLFGEAHVSLDYVDNDTDDSLNASSNTSRIGVKGDFDLGQGWAALYYMEWQVDITDSTGSGNGKGGDLAPRNRYAGFANEDFGTFVVGRHDTPFKTIGRAVDFFWSTQLGQNRSIVNQKDGGAGWDFRADNVLGYVSPNFGPVHVFAAYVTDHNIRVAGAADQTNTIQDDQDFDAISVVGIFDQKSIFSGDDSLYVALGYEEHNINPNAGTTLADSENAYRASVKYGIGDLTVAGMYQKAEDQGFVSGRDRDSYGGGLSYKVGDNTFKGQVYVADDLDGVAGSSGAILYALGVDHEFSKNVYIYAQADALDADDSTESPFTFGGNGHGTTAVATPGETTYGISLGTRVKF